MEYYKFTPVPLIFKIWKITNLKTTELRALITLNYKQLMDTHWSRYLIIRGTLGWTCNGRQNELKCKYIIWKCLMDISTHNLFAIFFPSSQKLRLCECLCQLSEYLHYRLIYLKMLKRHFYIVFNDREIEKKKSQMYL